VDGRYARPRLWLTLAVYAALNDVDSERTGGGGDGSAVRTSA
jgi:hypothetical protein